MGTTNSLSWILLLVAIRFSAGIYLLKINNRNTRTKCEIWPKFYFFTRFETNKNYLEKKLATTFSITFSVYTLLLQERWVCFQIAETVLIPGTYMVCFQFLKHSKWPFSRRRSNWYDAGNNDNFPKMRQKAELIVLAHTI